MVKLVKNHRRILEENILQLRDAFSKIIEFAPHNRKVENIENATLSRKHGKNRLCMGRTQTYIIFYNIRLCVSPILSRVCKWVNAPTYTYIFLD